MCLGAASRPLLHEVFAEKTLAAVPEAVALSLRDAFGSPLDAGILLASANRDGAACQAGVAKVVTGCARAQRQAALSCAKKSLAQGTASSAALATACLMTAGDPATGIPDPTGKLVKACATAVDGLLARTCAGQVAAALPGVCGTAADPGDCLVGRAGCRVCQELDAMLGTARDGDLFDDGLDNTRCGDAVPVCGNGHPDAPPEQCDDGNQVDGDCCSASCPLESTPCPAPSVVIDTPAYGTFSQAAQVTVDGHVDGVNRNDALLTINGTPVVVQPDGTFSTTLAPDTARAFTLAFARLVRQRDGAVAADRIAVIAGAERAAGAAAPSGLALRLKTAPSTRSSRCCRRSSRPSTGPASWCPARGC
jgi:cysteine-rich repeat protein